MRTPNMPAAESIAETIEELRFYLAHSMAEQARVVFAKLEKLKPGAAQLAAVWQEIEAAEARAGSSSPKRSEEVSVERGGRGPVRSGSRQAPTPARFTICSPATRKNSSCRFVR